MSKDFYSTINASRVINATGTMTMLGGCRMFPEAAEAMAVATQSFVDLVDLHERVGERIADMLNAEAAIVTAGASPALVQATAACIAGCNPYMRSRLPAFPPSKRDVIVMRCHRNPYDNALPTAGAQFVEIGDMIKTHDWELENAINENTAAVLFVLMSEMLDASLSLRETIEVAHQANVPVIVDAAAELPPKSNLWTLTQQGADLVAFSGGKEIRGPQTSGLLIGRKDLIKAAAFNGAPFYGVGRPMKASKEMVIGLLAALECYLAEDETARFAYWKFLQKSIVDALGNIEGIQVSEYLQSQPGIQPVIVPKLKLILTGDCPITIDRLIDELKTGNPCVIVDRRPDAIILNMQTLMDDEVEVIIDKIKSILSKSK
jgi:uncharacterized pyridoxal phosphate-dependent enzyme